MGGASGLLYVGTSNVVLKLGEPLCLVRMQATLDVRLMARNTRKAWKGVRGGGGEMERVHSHPQLECIQEMSAVYASDLQSNRV